MQSLIVHGPELARYASLESWRTSVARLLIDNDLRYHQVLYVDAWHRLLTCSTHWQRVIADEAWPVVVYRVDGEE